MVSSANGHTDIVKMLLEHHDINVAIRNNHFGPDGNVREITFDFARSCVAISKLTFRFSHLFQLFPQNAADMAQNTFIKDLINNHGKLPTQWIIFTARLIRYFKHFR